MSTIFRVAQFVLFVSMLSFVSLAQITPSQDAYTNSASPTTNFGTATTLGVVSSTTSIQTMFVQFDLSSIPSGYTSVNIAKATLKLYVNSLTTAGSFNIDLVSGSWSEKTITASVSPALGSTIASSVPLTSANVHDYVLIDVTTAVDDWLSGNQPNDGLALVANSPLNATIDSKENTTQSHPPEIDIVFAGGGTITGVTTASGSGLTGGGTSGTLNLSLLKTCSSNQTLQFVSGAWKCGTAGTGTVTSVGLSAPSSDFTVSGSPVTTSGTLGLGWTVAPTSADIVNAIVKRDSLGNFAASAIAATTFTGANASFSGTVLASGFQGNSLTSNSSIILTAGNSGHLTLSPAVDGSGNSTLTVTDGYAITGTAPGATIAGGGASCSGCGNGVLAIYGTVGGGVGNIAGAAQSSGGDTVSGGVINSATGSYSTAGGGFANNASGHSSTVAGGYNNIASGYDSTATGGTDNTASGFGSTVAGGFNNKASGDYSMAPGGYANTGGGKASFAAGQNATASDDGSFVWCQTNGSGCGSLGQNSFVVSVLGPIYFFDGPGGSGCNLAAGGGSWNCSSDRNLKDEIVSIDTRSVIELVAQMPITQWKMKAEPVGRKHIGPMAQDFYAAFGLGDSDRYIALGDGQGVALAAIQGLNQKLEEKIRNKDAEITALSAQVRDLQLRLFLVVSQMEEIRGRVKSASSTNGDGGVVPVQSADAPPTASLSPALGPTMASLPPFVHELKTCFANTERKSCD